MIKESSKTLPSHEMGCFEIREETQIVDWLKTISERLSQPNENVLETVPKVIHANEDVELKKEIPFNLLLFGVNKEKYRKLEEL